MVIYSKSPRSFSSARVCYKHLYAIVPKVSPSEFGTLYAIGLHGLSLSGPSVACMSWH